MKKIISLIILGLVTTGCQSLRSPIILNMNGSLAQRPPMVIEKVMYVIPVVKTSFLFQTKN